MDKVTIGVIGGGSWATALIKMFTEKEVKINWWMRNKECIDHITTYGHNPHYLSSAVLNIHRIFPTSDIKKVIRESDWVLLAVPGAFISDALKDLTPEDFKGKKILSSIKGMVPSQNILVTEYMERYFNVPIEDMAVIGGPCHAEEVAMEKRAYLTIASPSLSYAQVVSDQIKNRYTGSRAIRDLYGVEYCSVMKNIIAIACGIAHGLNYGDNFQAVLVSNAMKEIKQFLKAAYKIKRDLTSSAYLGDLLVTTYSQFSRNRTFGNMIGRGYSVKSAQMEMKMIAEGYYAVKSVYEINQQFEIDMPITKSVYHIVYDKISPVVEFRILEEYLK